MLVSNDKVAAIEKLIKERLWSPNYAIKSIRFNRMPLMPPISIHRTVDTADREHSTSNALRTQAGAPGCFEDCGRSVFKLLR